MVTLHDIEKAAQTIEGHVIRTPFLHSRTLSEITGAEVGLKFENHQFTASFKEREALVVAIGGGGLIAGISTAPKALKSSIDVFGVAVKRFPGMYHAVQGTTPQFAASTIAEGIAVKEPGALTLPIIKRNVREILLV